MKYILKYKIKSKYFGFIKEYYRDFDDLFEICTFLANTEACGWRVYKIYDISYSEMMRGEENENE